MEHSGSFFETDWYNPSITLYSFKVTNAVITKPRTVIKSINGTHQVSKSNNEVGGVWFIGANVEHFPRGLPGIFPNLTRLEINNCGLKQITRQDLVGLEGLVGLTICNNLIESLPDDLFVGMRNLQKIYFDDNNIRSASSKLLEPIENTLKFAFFSGNVKIDVSFNPLTPATLIELKQHLDKCDKPIDIQAFNDALGSKHELMWASGKYSDFTVVVDENEFKVHKNILGTQSSVFEMMFEQEMEENLTGKLEIDIFSADAVEEFLRFFYVPKAPSAQNSVEVFKLAGLYDMPALKDLCEEIIIKNVNESNVVQVLELANVHNLTEMKNSAVGFVKSLVPGWSLQDSVFDDCEATKKLIEVKNYIELPN